MRVLHTADWHLGQNLYGKSRQAEHEAFLRWLIEQIDDNHVDAVVVAGDVFDTGTPPSYARKLLNNFVVELQKHNCQLVLLAGNHDAVATLNESQQIFTCLNTQLITAVIPEPSHPNYSQQIIPLHNRQGELSVLLCAVPYIRATDVTLSKRDSSAQEKKDALFQGIHDHYQNLFAAAQMQQAAAKQPVAIMATGHLTAAGSALTDSVRELYIGLLDALPASAFPAADYIALGHIHRSQLVGQCNHIRYCGSPIPLSFDELNKAKEVLLVDFAAGKLVQITPLLIPIFQPMQTIKGNEQEIQTQLSAFSAANSATPVWVDVEVNSALHRNDLHQQILKFVEKSPVEILRLRLAKTAQNNATQTAEKVTLEELKPEDVFEQCLVQKDFEEDLQQRLRNCFKQTLSQIYENQTEAAL